jgi:hypothetical protein
MLEWSDSENPDYDEYKAICRLCGHAKYWMICDEPDYDPVLYRASIWMAIQEGVPESELRWWAEQSERAIDEVLGDEFEKIKLPRGGVQWLSRRMPDPRLP